MSLATTPSRYISFTNIVINPTNTETRWRVVENGFYASRGCTSFKEVMFFFGGDVLFNLLRPEGCDSIPDNKIRVNITHDEDGEVSASWGMVGAHADTEDKALRLLARFVMERGDITHLPPQLRVYCVEEIDRMILDLQNKRKALQ